jgi:hypothetical protein
MAVEAGKLLARHGAEDSRLLLAGPAGEASGTHVFVAQVQSWEAYGTLADELETDHEFEVLMDRLTREDSPLVLLSQGLSVEIPLDRKSAPGRGHIVEVYISRVLPGRFDAALELAGDVFDYVERGGAVNTQVAMQTLAGSMTDTLIVSWELPNMRTLGKLGDSYMSEPDGQAIMARLTGADAPGTTVSSGIYTEIPI